MNDSPDDTDRPDESDADDEDGEFKFERAYDREELAAIFREFATAFDAGRPIRLNGDDRTVRIAVPERVVAEFETELDLDETPSVGELELELEWDDADGSTVQLTDRDTTGDAAGSRDREGTTTADADPAAAVMPLEGITDRTDRTDRSGRTDDVDAEEVTAEGARQATPDGNRAGEPGRASRFEVYEDTAGQWRWRLVHWNGNIVADSGQGYGSRSNAERAARSVMRSAPTASIQRRECADAAGRRFRGTTRRRDRDGGGGCVRP